MQFELLKVETQSVQISWIAPPLDKMKRNLEE